MKIDVPLDHGLIPDKYAKFAPKDQRTADMPTTNFPIHVTDLPTGTQSLAVSLIDYDAIPVGGFSWIHWLAANIPVGNIPENLRESGLAISGTNSTWHFVQKANQPANPDINQAYIGPMPPDKTHDYTLTVFALDTLLDLENGFFLNDFKRHSQGHILKAVTLALPARA
ncbi:MAG: YbhB/YbcL family Raf kinase inhibitor-like protein [Leuconostoc citreum]